MVTEKEREENLVRPTVFHQHFESVQCFWDERHPPQPFFVILNNLTHLLHHDVLDKRHTLLRTV